MFLSLWSVFLHRALYREKWIFVVVDAICLTHNIEHFGDQIGILDFVVVVVYFVVALFFLHQIIL